jgi:ubiquinone/menaquinone biosynthesis C-methylase UbiE
VKQGETYANAPASQSYLVRDAPSYFGDYYRFQIDRQVYPAFARLPDALRGRRAEFYRLMDDPDEALSFSRGQHAGSLGPAVVLARTLNLKSAGRLLDVGGGSGAFSITLCRHFPELTATILDFPSVETAAAAFVHEAGMADRITFVAGNALSTEWPGGQDVVLMSYLLSAVSASGVDGLLGRAFAALAPGGRLVVHDFMVDDDETGPPLAALWLLNAVTIDADVAALTPAWISSAARRAGFDDARITPVVPGTTRLLIARR